MTKEELKKEAEEYALNQWEGNLPWSVIQKAYYDGALPREKQIQIDAEQIRALQKQNGELTDKVKELEAQIEKMKRCEICKHYQGESCNYHSNWVKDCKENGMKLFEIKEIKEND